MKILASALFFFTCSFVEGQSFISYFTGDTADIATPTSFGLCLMGGATEDDYAMRWFLQRSGGGDIVVLRTSGSNGYNSYLYSQLGVAVNSVETILFNNATASHDPYVLRQIANAEAIFIAGGDQSTYVQDWRNTPVDTLINYLSVIKKIPVGGTSAGMAILGWAYFSAQNGSVTSAQALSNPYSSLVTVEQDNFLKLPFMRNTITDTHYDNPDRRGRHVTFLSRLLAAHGDSARGIACDEYTAVCIDSEGKARVFGGYPTYDDNAYFVQINCALPNIPETLAAGQPLTWDRNHEAIKAYNIKGDTAGTNWFDVSNWNQYSGGTWQNWYAVNGTFTSATGTPPCNGVMPVYHVNFTATISQQPAGNNQHSVLLKWTSSNEQNFNHHEVERSNNGKTFFKIGSVKSIDNGQLTIDNGRHNYNFTDHCPLSIVNCPFLFYRLKMVNNDDSFTFSKTEKVSLSIVHSPLSIAPNPATTQVQLKFSNPIFGKLQIEISDVSGKVMMQKVAEASNAITLSTSNLAAGSYVMKVSNEREEYVHKLIVIK